MNLDAIVVGSGPNGLAAAIRLAQAGKSVRVLEAAETIGGGTRTSELTLPGFQHDVCSAVHPMGIASPYLQTLPLAEHGLEWIHPDVPFAHPLEDGRAGVVHRSLEETVRTMGADAESYCSLMEPFASKAENLLDQVLGPPRVPLHPWLMGRFGWRGIWSAERLAKAWFREPEQRGLFAGAAAHSVLPLNRWLTGAVGLLFLITAHHRGWPIARGGSQEIVYAMRRYLESLDGEVVTGRRVTSLTDLPPSEAVLFDIAPRHVCDIVGEELPAGYRRKLMQFRYGPGVFKVDWALSDPIPWKVSECRRAGTVHVGGTLEEVAAAEQAAWSNRPAERPFLLVAQQSLFDPSRAPEGKHTGWAYCHVPSGSTVNMTDRIEAQMERFAPGFRDTILARHVMAPADFESYNSNNIGGDITGGVMDLRQILARPTARLRPYRTPNPKLFLCSASTPPGGGVHGMCGYYAAESALQTILATPSDSFTSARPG